MALLEKRAVLRAFKGRFLGITQLELIDDRLTSSGNPHHASQGSTGSVGTSGINPGSIQEVQRHPQAPV